jgi:hypothetical protein
VGPRQLPARSTVLEQRRRAERHVRSDERPPRRRRPALLGGGVLIAASAVAVGAGLFVVGFAALGLGGLLLLLPPRPQGEPGHRRRSHAVRVAAVSGGRGVVALMRGAVRAGALTFSAVVHYVATDGRDGAVRIGAAMVERATALGRAGATVGALGWSAVRSRAPKLWRLLVEAMRSFGREARTAWIRSWSRTEPILRRVWAGCLAVLARVAEELAPRARSAAERVSAYVDSRCRPR